MKTIEATKELFDKEISSYITSQSSLDLIKKASDYAEEKHKDQRRKNGDPYYIHVLNVAYELAKLHAGPKTIAAGFLHDTIEDCDVTPEEFKKEFGEEIYEIVEAVTKIGNLKFQDEKEYQAENHRKIFIAMANDIRVILVKLADRLHNMRTLQYMKPEKQQKISRETLEVYAPIAHRLGIAEIKNELEDLCFRYLEPDKYQEIARLVDSKKSEREAQINQMIFEVSEILKKHQIPFRIFGRSKHLYSINKKMITKNKHFEEILDLLAIRIVTQTELNCYEILGYIHATYRPIPGRLKDYIAVPKMNMYRSLHTTIVGPDGRIYEVQIRTEEMDKIAERGVAAHWAYKEGQYDKSREQKEIVSELEWLKSFSENNSDASEYMDHVIGDVFNANVYVMTPKGRVIDLPNGSCPIDFAYRIHTEVGHQTIGALVNGVLVPLNTVLKTGDVVELRTNKNSTPSEDWLKIVKTKHARNKINTYFQKKEQERREDYIKQGEQLLKEDIRKRGLNEADFDKEKIEKIAPQMQLHDYEDVMYALAVKSLSCQSIVEKLVKQSKKELDEENIKSMVNKNLNRRSKDINSNGIEVRGIRSMKIALAPCCTPVYGDEVKGFVSKGSGVKVHRIACPNINKDRARLIDVYWSKEHPVSRYDAAIRIYAKDRNYLLTDIITCISTCKANLMGVNVDVNREDLTAVAAVTITVEDHDHLENIMANLRKVNSVISVDRAIK